MVPHTKETLLEFDFDPRSLKLEITESVMMQNAERSASMLQELKTLGIRLSIDDFGTGYSSLSYLHRFPLDTLKIDRSFVSRMTPDGENAEIVRAILTLAKNMNMDVIAEGIETAEQFALLRDMGCDCGQGYYFARPLDSDAMGAILAGGSM